MGADGSSLPADTDPFAALLPEAQVADGGPAEELATVEPTQKDVGRGQAAERSAGHEPVAQESARVREAAPRAEPAQPQAPRAPADEAASDILRQVRLRLSPQLRQATIQLEPASLGRLDIRLEVRRGRVRAELSVERSDTLAVLERHAPELRAALAAAGFEGTELSLSLSQQDEPSRQGAPSRSTRARHRPQSERSTPALHEAVARTLARPGGIDTYA